METIGRYGRVRFSNQVTSRRRAAVRGVKSKIHYTHFPVATSSSPQQVGMFPVYGEVTGNVCNGFWILLIK